ncbi:PEGA domain-containing protein [Pseudothermotoga thermarum]|uniref:PEGA domain protein n=1 Tax=Pseudothermotoga thermarum DSM 5069 TaxID=688269 RepID=F7YVN9_9THEM|nr:PEGA domain-containing protein [Pseudothermotoga thermarum]AEH51704.1 PEGA domain protein [Pseudothermotoga thermarum DSM 5069]
MKKSLIVFLVISLVAVSFAEINLRNIIIVPKPSDLEVKVWLNKPEGSVYQIDEKIEIFFRVNKSCYVSIYSIGADGKITLLFPNRFDQNNYVMPNVNYKIPTSDKYFLKVAPPEGKAFVQIIASTSFIPILQQLKDLGTRQLFPILSEEGERYIQQQIIPYLTGNWVSDVTYYYVGRTPRTGTVRLESVPTGAYVYVDGRYVGRTPQTVTLDEGSHFATFYHDGRTITETFTVVAGRTITVTAVFQRTTIDVRSTPTEAQVFLDGVFIGLTPLQTEVTPGQHTLLITKEGYTPFQQTFTIVAGETRIFNVTLTRATATLRIFTNPTGAQIYIDGRYVGTAPSNGLSVTVDAGTRTITARLPDYEDAMTTVTINPGETRTVTLTLRPIPRTGVLNIFTTPVGASIFIDGRYVGTTTDRGLSVTVDAGVREVKATYPDYEDKVISVEVRAGETKRIDLVLEPIIRTSSVSINSTPSAALVYVNGYLRGITPLRIDLEYGTYEIVLIKGGYYAEVFTLVVDRPSITISRTLRPIP